MRSIRVSSGAMRMRALPAVLVACASLWAHAARADDASEAKRLFEEGRKALAENRVGAACEAFAEAKRLAPEACGVVQNLATCRQQQGRTLDASNEFEALGACAAKAGQPDRARFADEQRAALRPKLAFLTIVPGSGPKVVALFVDGVSTDPHSVVADGKARAFEPGPHRVEVEREGCAMERLTITLRAGETQSLVLPSVCGAAASTESSQTAAPAGAAPAGITPPPSEPSSQPVRWQIPLGWGAIVAGGLAAVGSIAPCGVIVIGQRDDGERDKARSTATVCTAVGISGAAVLATGIVLLLTAPSAKPAAAARAYGIAPRFAGSKDFGLDAYLRF